METEERKRIYTYVRKIGFKPKLTRDKEGHL